MLPMAGLWLARCLEPIEGVASAALFVGDTSEPAACWPDPDDLPSELVEVAAAAFASRRATLRQCPKDEDGNPTPGRLFAVPIELGTRSLAVVAMHCELDDPDAALFPAVREAGRWLSVVLSGDDNAKGGARHVLLARMVTKVLEAEEAPAAYLTLVSELATALSCDRVSLGFLEQREIRLQAVSHSACFDPRTRLGRAIAAAMEEAIDAEATIRWPGDPDAPHRAHATLCESHEMGSAFSVPLSANGEAIGALCAEYRNRHPTGAASAGRLEQLSTLLGPLIALRRDAALPITRRVVTALARSWEEWSGERRRPHLVVAAVVSFALCALALMPGTHRVGASSRLEGLVQRAIVAPIDGYVAESRARAGDVIEAGEILGAIDDTDLRLEKRKWTARASQLDKEYRAALAVRDRSEANILSARLAQARAELDLVEEQLSRTLLVAPFDGVVAEGDLSRSLGSPVGRGDVLFQVAPLDRYRIVLEVDETDIDEIEAGQPGSLKLAAQPGKDLPLTVERVVPVAVSEDGRNFFRVEASLLEPIDSLRPGMEGVGKIEVGRRSQLWMVTHSLFDWIRLRVWTWLP
jgi:multidrug efflux pump subunit AcrA (membrane-fusion protein)